MLKIQFTGQFKRDYTMSVRRGHDPDKLWDIIAMIANGRPLPQKCQDHALTNSRKYKNMRECHVEPDWLLVYKVVDGKLTLKLIRTGSHSDLF